MIVITAETLDRPFKIIGLIWVNDTTKFGRSITQQESITNRKSVMLFGGATIIREAREKALNNLIDKAKKNGADMIIGFRFDSVVLTDGIVEICCYGTAIKLL